MPAELSAAPEHDADLTGQPTTFAAFGVPGPLVRTLADQGIIAPFPVQAATLPDSLAGRDILGRAQTGSGKTLGFSLPLVSRLAGGATHRAKPRGLVLVPTRELASQVTEVLRPLARAMDLWVATIYGGVAYGPQVNALQRQTDIVVATPGRLADLIGQGECDLSEVEVTVIDEADQMADLGFLPIVRRLLDTTPDRGQRMLFSATLDAAVDVLARRFLHNPVLHSVDENSSPAEIEHHVFTVDAVNRIAVIMALAGGEKRSLVFTRTKHGAERLARQLTQAGIPAAELHGNLRQGARTRNLDAFTSGLARVMVATDIAARGIHIDGIDLVIHADPPAEDKAYVHRSGRTARGGAAGVVVTLQTRAQARDVTAMMKKADITPHAAVVADAESADLTEIAGPPAPRVSVSGKVSELVQPEERLARNDRHGAGKPWEGRPRRDRADGRQPRDDRFRHRAPRDGGGHGGGHGGGAEGGAGRAAYRGRDERAPVARRPERPESRVRADGDERSPRAGRTARFDGGNAGVGRDRGGRDATGGRGAGVREAGGRQGRDERGGNDWWPRGSGGGRPAAAGSRQPGSAPRAGGQESGGNRAWRDERPPFRGAQGQSSGRPQAGGQSSRPRSGRTDRPQAGGNSGGNFGGSSKRSGYSADRGVAGKRRDSGHQRHF